MEQTLKQNVLFLYDFTEDCGHLSSLWHGKLYWLVVSFSEQNKLKTHTRSARYSDAALEQKRLANHSRWLEKSKKIHPKRFSYPNTEQEYTTQKGKKVSIICLQHNFSFKVFPEKHIQNEHGGCEICSETAKSETRLSNERRKFISWFKEVHGKTKRIVSEFKGGKKPLTIYCSVHDQNTTIIPTAFKGQQGIGCEKCISEALSDRLRLTLDQAKKRLADILPNGITLLAVDYNDEVKQSLLTFQCAEHGISSGISMAHAKRSPYICRYCGEGRTGFASNRLRELVEQNKKGDIAKIGVMEIEALGVQALKVGVTTRTLEKRYLYHLKQIFYEVELHEIDAYVLENRIKIHFSKQKDERIIKAGMRDGKRWSGDTELYWFKNKNAIIKFIQNFIQELKVNTPDYDFELEHMVIPKPFPKRVGREKGKFNKAKPVIGIDPVTNKIVKKFPSVVAAREAGFINVSMAISEKYNRQFSGGLRWFFEENFDPETIPSLKPKRIGIPVYCVERNQHFISANEAARFLSGLGYNTNGSHITSVCNGQRRYAGGFTWQKSWLDHEKVSKINEHVDETTVPKKSAKRPRPIKLISNKDSNIIKTFSSLSEAARFLGCGAGIISRALKKNYNVYGYSVSEVIERK